MRCALTDSQRLCHSSPYPRTCSLAPSANPRPLAGSLPSLLGVRHGALLSNDGHLDLTGIFHLRLNLGRDIMCQLIGEEVIDPVRLDHHAHFPSRLDRVCLGNALEAP